MSKIIKVRSIIILVSVAVVITIFNVPFAQTRTSPNVSYPGPQDFESTPGPTLIPAIEPTPHPILEPSQFAIAARTFIAQREGIPSSFLVVLTDHSTLYPNLERRFQVVSLLDMRADGHIYDVLVDLATGLVHDDVDKVWAEEQQIQTERYGKLHQTLYERLQTLGDNDEVSVTIWIAAQPGGTLDELESTAFNDLAAKYPEVRENLERGASPLEIANQVLAAQVEADYLSLLEAGIARRIEPIKSTLQSQGIVFGTADGLPVVTATLRKVQILSLERRVDVGAIYLEENGERQLLLDSATFTNQAQVVWARGFDGSGVAVAILEVDNVDFSSASTSECPLGDNCFLQGGPTLTGMLGEGDHATLVGSIVSSSHSNYRGMASGATIISAGIQGEFMQDDIDALIWALDQGAEVVNASYRRGCSINNDMIDLDRAFDYVARLRNRLLVAAAGNIDGSCPFDFVSSPAKGWNVLSVGAYDDENTSDWADDLMADFSAFVNPESPNNDHEKPEVVAPGVEVVGIIRDGLLETNPDDSSGTSFSAPQVAGLVALLLDRNQLLLQYPLAMRAIIMASANHNIEGPTGIPSG